MAHPIYDAFIFIYYTGWAIKTGHFMYLLALRTKNLSMQSRKKTRKKSGFLCRPLGLLPEFLYGHLYQYKMTILNKRVGIQSVNPRTPRTKHLSTERSKTF